MVYVIPLVCFVIPLILGVVAMRQGMVWVIPLVTVMLAVLMAWAIWMGRQHQGWDAIGYGIFAALMAAPAILGVLIGGGIGWWQRRRRAARGEG